MAAKAQRRLIRGHAPSQRSFEAAWSKCSPSSCEVQSVEGFVKAHTALKIDSVLLIQEGVTKLPVTEYPTHDCRGGLLAIAGRILCAVCCLGNGILVGPGTEVHLAGEIREPICGCRFHST